MFGGFYGAFVPLRHRLLGHIEVGPWIQEALHPEGVLGRPDRRQPGRRVPPVSYAASWGPLFPWAPLGFRHLVEAVEDGCGHVELRGVVHPESLRDAHHLAGPTLFLHENEGPRAVSFVARGDLVTAIVMVGRFVARELGPYEGSLDLTHPVGAEIRLDVIAERAVRARLGHPVGFSGGA